jgi:hypothetical protein
MAFNPFDKPVGSRLEQTDLQLLVSREVAEGYYVEYKSAPNSNEKTGHTLASFANTSGGWYFVGVRENSKHVAAAIEGFKIADWHDPTGRVRDIAKAHISPMPVLFPQLIELGGGRGVLAVQIPDGQETPFLTKDGRIYRRAVDSSAPIPETDRHAMDRLVERGAKRRERFNNFAQDTRRFSKTEGSHGWANIYISPRPFGTIEREGLATLSSMESLLEKSRKPGKIPLSQDGQAGFNANLPFSGGQPAFDSVLLKQSAPHTDAFNALTLELDIYGRAKILVPIEHASGIEAWHVEGVRSSRARDAIESSIAATHDQYALLHRCNMEKLWLTVACLVSYYLDWLGEDGSITGYDVAIDLKNVWRFVPFFDFDSWGEHVGRFGLPVVKSHDIRIPDRGDQALIYQRSPTLPLWLHLLREISLAFGLPPDLFSENLVATIFRAAETGKQ